MIWWWSWKVLFSAAIRDCIVTPHVLFLYPLDVNPSAPKRPRARRELAPKTSYDTNSGKQRLRLRNDLSHVSCFSQDEISDSPTDNVATTRNCSGPGQRSSSSSDWRWSKEMNRIWNRRRATVQKPNCSEEKYFRTLKKNNWLWPRSAPIVDVEMIWNGRPNQ